MSKRQRRRRRRKQRRHQHLVPTKRQLTAAGGLALGASLITGASAQAATFTVNSTADPGDNTCDTTPAGCTLRDALDDANNNNNSSSTVDIIVFESGLSGTIFTPYVLPISEAVDIQGPGADQLEIFEASNYEAISINLGPYNYDPVTISGLEIGGTEYYADIFNFDSTLALNNAVIPGYLYDAGGVYSRFGDVTLNSTTITGNYAAAGGGIYNVYGDTTLNSSDVSDNSANYGGGGIRNLYGNVAVNSSTMTGNEAGDEGGAIYAFRAPVSIQGSNVSYNDALGFGGGGGAVWIDDSSQLTVQSSTLSGNTANRGGAIHTINAAISGSALTYNTAYTGPGGAVLNVDGSLSIQNSTLSGNVTDDVGGGAHAEQNDSVTIEGSTISDNIANSVGGVAAYAANSAPVVRNSTFSGNYSFNNGGGFYSGGSVGPPGATITSSTFAGNTANGDGGGVLAYNSPTTLQNTIVAGNTAPNGPDLFDDSGDPFNAAFSLIQNTSDVTINETAAGSNLIGVDPQLGPLQNNGGPTSTRALASTSPAVDKGSSFGLTTDQRGSVRPVDGPTIPNSTAAGANGADIGAFEISSLPGAPGGGGAGGATCKGKTATIVGTSGANTLTGTNARDVIAALGGNDKVSARGGNDLVCLGGGKDRAKGGGGKDKEFGGAGKDTLAGNGGKDTLAGQGGRDTLRGGAARDKLKGGAKRDLLIGGGGNDVLKGGGGADVLRGGGGLDILAGGAGADTQTQ